MVIEIAVAVALLLGVLLARSPLGSAVKKGLCDGVSLGMEDIKKHPQDGKTLEELESSSPAETVTKEVK